MTGSTVSSLGSLFKVGTLLPVGFARKQLFVQLLRKPREHENGREQVWFCSGRLARRRVTLYHAGALSHGGFFTR